MRIWVVVGESGEYSDRREWLTKAFPTERAAQMAVTSLGEVQMEIFAPLRNDRDWTYDMEREAIAKMKIYDPAYAAVDHDGATWYVSEVELVL